MVKPTYQDATLMLQIAQWGAALEVNEASNWMWSDQFVPDNAWFVKKYPPGSEGFANVSKICGYIETIGTLYKQGLFNEELLFDWMAVSHVWDRSKVLPLGGGSKAKSPGYTRTLKPWRKPKKDNRSLPHTLLRTGGI